MRIKVGDLVFDSKEIDVCVMLSEEEHAHVASMEPNKEGPRFYGLYRNGIAAHDQFRKDQEILKDLKVKEVQNG